MRCDACGGATFEEFILPEHIEDVGGIDAVMKNTVHVRRCRRCGDEQTMIPDLRGMVRAVAVARAVIPVALRAADLRLMRRALDMSQRDFAKAMEVAPETVSRWEAGAQGVGGYSEKLVRHNVTALLAKDAPGVDFEPADITRMVIVKPPEGARLRIVVELVTLKRDGARSMVWDAHAQCELAA